MNEHDDKYMDTILENGQLTHFWMRWGHFQQLISKSQIKCISSILCVFKENFEKYSYQLEDVADFLLLNLKLSKLLELFDYFLFDFSFSAERNFTMS